MVYLTQVGRGILILEWRKNLVNRRFTDIDQHVCVREALHCANLIPLHWRNQAIQSFTPVVLLQHFTVSDGCDAVIVEFQPACLAIRLDQREVVSAV